MTIGRYIFAALAAASLLLASCSSSSTAVPSAVSVAAAPAPVSAAAGGAGSATTSTAGGSAVAPSAAASGGPDNACGLADSADVTKAFGGKVTGGAASSKAGSCVWHVAAATFGADCDVTVSIPAFPDDKKSFDDNKNQGGAAPTVPGVGDDAYHPEQGNPSLQFRKGDSVAEVDLKCTSDPDDTKEDADVVTLAKTIVAKL